MEHPTLRADLTVAEVLRLWPRTMTVFFRHQMGCVGCSMAPFDTLAEVAANYGFSVQQLLLELEEAIHT